MTESRGICSLSLDLDNQWSYMKTHGDAGWQEYPSYLDIVVPRFLDVLAEFGWTITVFIVGQDAALQRNHDALRMITGGGHEVGNHSFNHEPWLHLYSVSQIADEIAHTEEAIENATGRAPKGFRGPGYSLSRSTLEVLADRGYDFDASTFPTYLGPLARAYYFMTSSFDREERDKRKALFGSLRDGLRPLKPYNWQLGERTMLEIPVTTMPAFKVPFHFSYLLYISTYSETLAKLHFKSALRLCRLGGIEPSLLLHPLDFLGGDDVPCLDFFPAMRLGGAKKVDLIRTYFRRLHRHFEVLPMTEHARHIRSERVPKQRTPDFKHAAVAES